MSVEIKKVSGRRDFRRFVDFGYKLYKGNPYAVPDLRIDLKNTLRKDKNPAFDFCKAEYFLAYKEGKLVGRVAAIINDRVNERWNSKTVRFGWIDFIDDREVSAALLKAVEEWGRENGMDQIVGPMGFADLDKEGMLTEGFDKLSTMSTLYNYPYYPEHLISLGYEKKAEWIEQFVTMPENMTDRPFRLAKMVLDRYNLHYVEAKNVREMEKAYGRAIFELLTEAYHDLFGYVPLTDKQIDYYIGMYLTFLNLQTMTLIADSNDRLIGVGISMPSLSKALQKCRGRLFPLGWWYLLKALYFHGTKGIDMLMIGVARDYVNKGIPAVMMAKLVPNYLNNGFEWAETTIELEDNSRVQAVWDMYSHTIHKRRVAFGKDL